MKTFLIAGGAGFIGSNLSKKLIEQGHKVIIIDDLSTGSLKNIYDLPKDRCEIIQASISEKDFITSLSSKIDVIINLACKASPRAYYADPVGTLLTSVVGTKNLLDLALDKKSIFLQASTSEIYGDPLPDVQNEDYNGNVNCLGLRACYDEGKRAAETLCMDYRRQFGANVRIIRIFNTYGPNMAIGDGRAIPEFIVSAIQNRSLIINGNGTQTRSFMYIDDLLRAIEKIIQPEIKIDSPVNIGNPNEEHSITELAQMILKLTGSKSNIIHIEGLKDDPSKRRPDITKARHLLDWSPEINLEVGLSKTIDFYLSKIKI